MLEQSILHLTDVCVLYGWEACRDGLRNILETYQDDTLIIACLMPHAAYRQVRDDLEGVLSRPETFIEWMADGAAMPSLAAVPAAAADYVRRRARLAPSGRIIVLHDLSWAWRGGCSELDLIAYAMDMRECLAGTTAQVFHFYPPRTFPITARWRLMRCHHAVFTGEGISQNLFFSPMPDAAPSQLALDDDLDKILEQLRWQGWLQAELMGTVASTWSIAARRERDLQALKHLTETVDRGRSLDEVLGTSLEHVLELLQMEGGAVVVFDGDGTDVRCTERALPPLTLDELRSFRVLQPPRREASGSIHWVGDFSETDEEEAPVSIRAALRAPLMRKESCLGVLQLVCARVRRFSLEDLQLAQTVANQLALAIDNERLQREHLWSEQRWGHTFDSLPDILVIRDNDFRILQVNRAVRETLQRSDEELRGRLCYEALYGLKEPCTGCAARLTARTEVRTERVGDETYMTSVSPLLDENGACRGAVHHGRNVTTERQLLNKLVEAERMADLGSLISSVAHEINNPMTTVVGFTEMLALRADLPKELRDPIDCIRNEAQRAASVVRNLLGCGRRNPVSRASLDVNEVLQMCARVRRNDLKLHGMEIVLELDGTAPRILGDASMLQQVFMNLLSNASYAVSHHRATGGQIRIRSEHDNEELRVYIADNGPGIAVDVIGALFKSFVTTKPPGEGTGLGLSICSAIVRDHGGHIEVVNRPEGGALFTMHFPIPLQIPTEAPRPAAASSAKPASSHYTILVIDDEPMVRLVLKQMLELIGHKVDVAGTAADALERLGKGRFDLIVSDVHMPDLSGPRLREEAQRRNNDVPFLFVTGDTSTVTLQDSGNDSAPGFLLKPFKPPALQAAVDNAVKRARRSMPREEAS